MSLISSRSYARLRYRAASPRVWLTLLILGLACYRLTLIGSGHFFWSDERCYLPAADLVDAASAGDFRAAATHLFEARGKLPPSRPVFVLVSVLPTLLQRISAPLLGIDPNTPQYFDIACAFNVLVTLAITLFVYALGRLWTGCPWFALLIAVVYSLLSGANVWIRHLAPYNTSLLLFLSGLWLLSTKPRPDKRDWVRVMLAGLLTAMGFACYPGHYAFVLINGVVAFARSRRWIGSAVVFGASSAAVIGMFELLAHVAGRSYIRDLTMLSGGGVAVGYPGEGFAFLWHYLSDVEGAVGITLHWLFVAFVLLILWRRSATIPRTARAALLAAVGCYLFHASMGVFGGSMVFFGRVLMIYIPFVVAGSVLALMNVRSDAFRRICVGGLICGSAVSFIQFAVPYSRIVYPAEFLQDTMTNLGRDIVYPSNVLWGYVDGDRAETVESIDPELTTVVDPRPDGTDSYVWLASHTGAWETGTRFIAVNLKFLWYVRGRYDRFTAPPGYELVAEALHPEVFPATTYEGRKPWERNRIRDRRYTMKIYERVEQRRQLANSSDPRDGGS